MYYYSNLCTITQGLLAYPLTGSLFIINRLLSLNRGVAPSSPALSTSPSASISSGSLSGEPWCGACRALARRHGAAPQKAWRRNLATGAPAGAGTPGTESSRCPAGRVETVRRRGAASRSGHDEAASLNPYFRSYRPRLMATALPGKQLKPRLAFTLVRPPHDSINNPSRPVPASTPPFLPLPMHLASIRLQSPTCATRLPSHTPSSVSCAEARDYWSNFRLQLVHAACCRSSCERRLLEVVQNKIALPYGTDFSAGWAKLVDWKDYDRLASILICAGYRKVQDFVCCGWQRFRCQDLLCPRCSYHRLIQPLHEEFGDRFAVDREVWYIVTSLSTNPDEASRFHFRDLGPSHCALNKTGCNIAQPCPPEQFGLPFTTPHDLIQHRKIWDLMSDSIREVTGTGRGMVFSGAVGGPELAVQFQPLRALPHANFLVWSPGFSADVARKLRRLLREKLRNCRSVSKLHLYPAVACYRLGSPDDLRRVISYVSKPIDLATAYTMTADRIGCEPHQMVELNCETKLFLENLGVIFHRLPRIMRFGACHASHSNYFGQVTPWRQQQRERAAERRKTQAGNGGRPVWRSKSRTASWLDWLDHYIDFGRPSFSRFDDYAAEIQRRIAPPPPPPSPKLTTKN